MWEMRTWTGNLNRDDGKISQIHRKESITGTISGCNAYGEMLCHEDLLKSQHDKEKANV